MIEIVGLSKTYGDKRAVSDLTLSVEPGTIFGFVGPNGAGKTTTLKMLAGLLRPTSGNARICGVDVVADPIRVKEILGYLPDNPFLYDYLTITEFLTFVGDVYKIPESRIREKGEEYLRLFDLTNQAGHHMAELSFGMKKKAALTALLVREPRVLLLDEPTSSLDPKAVKTLRDLLLKMASEGTTVFFSTHILEVAQRISHTVGIIAGGKLIASGTMDELKARVHADNRDLEGIFLSLTENDQARIDGESIDISTE